MRDPYDYSLYSLEQLLDARAHINRALYPERAAEIDRWVAQRSSERDAEQAATQPFDSPAISAVSTRPLLAACGVAAIVAIATIVSVVAVLVVRWHGEDEASKSAAQRVVTAVTRDWDPEELRNSASQEFKPVTSDPATKRVFKMFRQLGTMNSLGEPTGGARATAGIGAATSGITAEYSFPAKFAHGDATIRVKLIRESGEWKTTGFFVTSDTFLPR